MKGPTGYSNPCIICGARPFEQCRSLTKGRKTDTHSARVRGVWPAPSDGSPPPAHSSGGVS